jgi:hypothetical protein
MPYYAAEVHALENENVQGVVTDCGTITLQASSTSGARSILHRIYGRDARIYNLRETNSEGQTNNMSTGSAFALLVVLGYLYLLAQFFYPTVIITGLIILWKIVRIFR